LKNKIHIVSFDQLFPTNYGGIIDVFYRAKTIKDQGFYVILHCFYKGEINEGDYSQIANEVYFYKRESSFLNQFSLLPFIIKSRQSKELLKRLKENNYPILLEGHHCCDTLLDTQIDNKRISVRIHNHEVEYYSLLAKNERNLLKKYYYKLESFKLELFEKQLKKANHLYCLTEKDQAHYKKIHPSTFFWRIGVDTTIIESSDKIVNQVVYIGNLSVNENIEAVDYLINFWKKKSIQTPLLIAGKNPDQLLVNKIQNQKNVKLFANPTDDKINELLAESKFNIALSFQETGMKIKIIHNLLKGNICLANEMMVKNLDIKNYVTLFTFENLKEILENAILNSDEIKNRKRVVQKMYDLKDNFKNTPLFFDIFC
jgi:hypothetical protein